MTKLQFIKAIKDLAGKHLLVQGCHLPEYRGTQGFDEIGPAIPIPKETLLKFLEDE